MDDKRPVKSKNLKIIDYQGIYYASLGGEKLWEIDDILYGLLKECDGKKTFHDIAKKISDKSSLEIDRVEIGIKPLFKRLEDAGFIEFI